MKHFFNNNVWWYILDSFFKLQWHSVKCIPLPRPNSPRLLSLVDTSLLYTGGFFVVIFRCSAFLWEINDNVWKHSVSQCLGKWENLSVRGLFWVESHPPSKFHGNLRCIILPSNQQTQSQFSSLFLIRNNQRYLGLIFNVPSHIFSHSLPPKLRRT